MLYYFIDGSLNPCRKLRFMYKVSNAKLSEPDCAAWLCRKLVASDALRRKMWRCLFTVDRGGTVSIRSTVSMLRLCVYLMYVYVS